MATTGSDAHAPTRADRNYGFAPPTDTFGLGLCPQLKQTGGKVKSSHTRKGKNRAARAFRLAAWSLMRSKSSLGAFIRHKRSSQGPAKAITTTAHKLARIVYHLVRYGVSYVKETEAAFEEKTRKKQEKQLHRRARELGYELKKVEAPVTPSENPSVSDAPPSAG